MTQLSLTPPTFLSFSGNTEPASISTALLRSRSSTIAYRLNIASVFQPQSCNTTCCGTPARMRLWAAVRRKSWGVPPTSRGRTTDTSPPRLTVDARLHAEPTHRGRRGPLKDPAWLFEPKYDGFRGILYDGRPLDDLLKASSDLKLYSHSALAGWQPQGGVQLPACRATRAHDLAPVGSVSAPR